MHFLNLLLILASVFTAILGSSITPKLKSLGNIEGKTFFVDDSDYRNWTSSKTYCESFGMTLGQITSEAQYNFLKGRNNTEDFEGIYWTAGRDVKAADQFLWEGSSIRTGSQAYLKWGGFSGPYTCVFYQASSGSNNGNLYADSCVDLAYVLCQS